MSRSWSLLEDRSARGSTVAQFGLEDGARPEGRRVDAVRVVAQHLVEHLYRGPAAGEDLVEDLEVLAGGGDAGRRVRGTGALVAGYHRRRVELGDQVEAAPPALALLHAGSDDERVHLVVDDVAGHDEVEVGHVHEGAVFGVALTGPHDAQL